MEGSVVTYGLGDSAEKVGKPVGEVWRGLGVLSVIRHAELTQ